MSDPKKEKSHEQRVHEIEHEGGRSILDKRFQSTEVATRKLIRLNDAGVRCPLCLDFFEKMFDPIRRIAVYACHRDKIGIPVADPHVGRWEEFRGGEKIPCPACDSNMRFFSTSAGAVKVKCPKPKCGAAVTKVEPDRGVPGASILNAGDAGEPLLLDKPKELLQ